MKGILQIFQASDKQPAPTGGGPKEPAPASPPVTDPAPPSASATENPISPAPEVASAPGAVPQGSPGAPVNAPVSEGNPTNSSSLPQKYTPVFVTEPPKHVTVPPSAADGTQPGNTQPEIPNPQPAERPPVVEFRNVSKSFDGKKVVVEDINFTIEDKPGAGELIAIVGTSGCGKSTVAKILTGLSPHYPPTTGEVLVFGKPVTGPGVDRGLVDQKYSLLPHLNVADNIAFGLQLAGVSRKERRDMAREWVQKVGLAGSEHKYPHELSGGMQQRVAIASTLILKPRIVLMDEPFGALDPKIRVQMQDLLITLWEEQESTIFFITHSAEEAIYLGDQVFRMSSNPGRIAEIITSERPDKPLREMRKDSDFNERVAYLLLKLEEESTGHMAEKVAEHVHTVTPVPHTTGAAT